PVPSLPSTPTLPIVTNLLGTLTGISSTLSSISNSIGQILTPTVNILDPNVLSQVGSIVTSLGSSGPLSFAINEAILQAQRLQTTLSIAESILLVRRLNNEVVQAFSQLLQALEDHRLQLGQASSSTSTTQDSSYSPPDLIRGIFSGLNLSLRGQISLNDQLVKVLDPSVQAPGQAVSDAMRNLLSISLDIYRA
ncbi:hypothetical protein CH063_08677, partial [Colletotrichum higginsianum]